MAVLAVKLQAALIVMTWDSIAINDERRDNPP
jgi:hypothetical protein